MRRDVKKNVKKDATSLTSFGYLVMGSDGAMRLTALAPRVEPWEISIRLAVKVPLALFSRPALSATVVVPDAAAGKPQKIETEIIANMQAAVKAATGLDLSITILPSEDPR